MVKKYQNREWLYNKYWNEKLSKHQIAKLCGIGYTTIHYYMTKNNILRRSISEAKHLRNKNHCNLSKEAIKWLDGELLGDGGVYSRSPFSAVIGYGSKYYEYCKYVKDTLQKYGIKIAGKIYRVYNKKSDSYTYSYQSLSYPELLPLRKKWYPKGKKIVPKSIKLSPLTCRQWHIGDGCLKKGKDISIFLSTDNFIDSDVEWLVKKLSDLGFKAKRQLSNNRIRISRCSAKEFLDYIGECPVSCYQYKFSY